jgi:UDP-N-acetylglucosamine enolpyruvyl transferase
MGARSKARAADDHDRGRARARRLRSHRDPDRIEAGTLLIAGAITGGNVMVKGARAEHLEALLTKLEDAGVAVDRLPDAVGFGRARAARRPTSSRRRIPASRPTCRRSSWRS